jgi:predicted 3-demethylubiquinone-9 3-methyltransferase (glyoxalase superfamily)
MKLVRKTAPCLWFDDQAEAVATYYTSNFPNSGISPVTRCDRAGHEIHGRPVR